MDNITVSTWTGSGTLSLKGNSLYLDYQGKNTVIPISQIISFSIKDPKSKMKPGMISIRLGGSSDTRIKLTSFMSIGGSNNIEFPHAYAYAEAAHRMQARITELQTLPTQVTQTPSAADELRKFKALLDDGIITDEEFTEKKRQLLGL